MSQTARRHHVWWVRHQVGGFQFCSHLGGHQGIEESTEQRAVAKQIVRTDPKQTCSESGIGLHDSRGSVHHDSIQEGHSVVLPRQLPLRQWPDRDSDDSPCAGPGLVVEIRSDAAGDHELPRSRIPVDCALDGAHDLGNDVPLVDQERCRPRRQRSIRIRPKCLSLGRAIKPCATLTARCAGASAHISRALHAFLTQLTRDVSLQT